GHRALVLAVRGLAAEAAEEFLEARRHLPALGGDALASRDVDHRRLEPLGEVGEAHRRAARSGGGDRAGLVLRRLRGDWVEAQCRGGAAEENGAGNAIDVTHGLASFLDALPGALRHYCHAM